jgi:cell division protein FtsB
MLKNKSNIKDLPKTLTKVLQVQTKAVTPTDEQIERIRPFLLRDFDPDELYVRRMLLANDQYDRSHERFDMGYLSRFAETTVGKSVLGGHDHKSVPIARFFDGGVIKEDNGWQWLETFFYMPMSPGNQLARDNIDSGVWSYVSIGANVDHSGLVCDICGCAYYPWYGDETAPTCRHIAGEIYDGRVCTTTWTANKSDLSKIEVVEGSIVYLGCQFDAAIGKSASDLKKLQEEKRLYISTLTLDSVKEGQDMNWEEKCKELEAANAELETKNAELTAKNSELTEQVAKLEPLAKNGEQYVTDTKAEIVRVAAQLGEESAYKFVVEKVDDLEKLKEIEKELGKKHDAKFPPTGKAVPGNSGAEKPSVKVGADRNYSVI